tara:strand:+ start:2945 stop:3229 length:285 start_codon:yes stop_codon:yes gene_type:complete
MKEKVLGYKIRNTETGLYSTCLYKDKWGRNGKTFSRMCDVVRAFNFASKYLKTYGKFSKISLEEYNEMLLSRIEIIELKESNSFSAIYILDRLK